MVSFNSYSEQLSSPILSIEYASEVSQLPFKEDEYSSSQAIFNTSIGSSPGPESSCSNTRSSTSSSSNDRPLRNRTCWVYKHMPDIDIGTKYYSTTSKLEWRCKYCSKRYTLNGGTRLIKLHLKKDHDISELSTRQERSLKRQVSIQDALILATSNPQKRRRLEGNLLV
jgi:hypothetical protein